MRQIMPHRSAMSLHRNQCKIILLPRGVFLGPATILQHSVRTPSSMGTDIRRRAKDLHVFQRRVGAPRPTTGDG